MELILIVFLYAWIRNSRPEDVSLKQKAVMVSVPSEIWSPHFRWSMRKLDPAKWGFPFEVSGSLQSPESSMVQSGGQQSMVAVVHHFQPWIFFWNSWTFKDPGEEVTGWHRWCLRSCFHSSVSCLSFNSVLKNIWCWHL